VGLVRECHGGSSYSSPRLRSRLGR
jgi:hypothetical protein